MVNDWSKPASSATLGSYRVNVKVESEVVTKISVLWRFVHFYSYVMICMS